MSIQRLLEVMIVLVLMTIGWILFINTPEQEEASKEYPETETEVETNWIPIEGTRRTFTLQHVTSKGVKCIYALDNYGNAGGLSCNWNQTERKEND